MQILLIGAHIESARVEAKLIVTALLLQGWLQFAPQKSLLVYVREKRLIYVAHHDRLTFSEGFHLGVLLSSVASVRKPGELARRQIVKVGRGLRLVLEGELFNVTFLLLELLLSAFDSASPTL